MRKHLLVLSALCTLLAAPFASAANSTYALINKGDFEAGGQLVYSATTFNDSSRTSHSFSILSPIRYFVIDRFSVGPLLGYSTTSNNPAYVEFGPSAAYYFWTDERLAAFVSQTFTYARIGAQDTDWWSMFTVLGLNYFLHPAVAVGPSVEYYHSFSSGSFTGATRIQLAAQFSVYF